MVQVTRFGGPPPSSRVYHSSPVLQQVQFPSRRRNVRQGGRQQRQAEAARLRQQTLTQIDFVSSFGEQLDIEPASSLLRDTEFGESSNDGLNDDNVDKEKCHRGDGAVGNVDHDEGEGEQESDSLAKNKRMPRTKTERTDTGKERASANKDNGPLHGNRKRRTVASKTGSYKKRRAAGDATDDATGDAVPGSRPKGANKSSRKRLDSTVSGPSYHTQTLTQFLGPTRVILDSDDDDDAEFIFWLEGPKTADHQSHRHHGPPPTRRSSPSHPGSYTSAHPGLGEELVVPQTPTRHIAARANCPSTQRKSTPFRTFRDGPRPSGKVSASPSNARLSQNAPELAHIEGKARDAASTHQRPTIQDSFATESWISGSDRTPVKMSLFRRQSNGILVHSATCSSPSIADRPCSPAFQKTELGQQGGVKEVAEIQVQPNLWDMRGPIQNNGDAHEIPDSDDEDDIFPLEGEAPCEGKSRESGEDEDLYLVGEDTQRAMKEVLGTHRSTPATVLQSSPALPHNLRSIPRGDASSTYVLDLAPAAQLDHAASLANMPRSDSPKGEEPLADHRPRVVNIACPLLTSSSGPRPIRRPIPPQPPQGQSQPFESQRVPALTLQALPPASFRTDILLPIPATMLACLLGGYRVDIHLPFKIPSQVVRFWLFAGSLLCYMACVGSGQPQGAAWRYPVKQMYELNNSVGSDEMREEGWISDQIQRYTYLPPAVVGQLLWNLRHAIFLEAGDDGDDAENQKSYHGTDDMDDVEKNSSGGMEMQMRPQSTPAASPSVSQQVAAQLHSDIVQSTQLSIPVNAFMPSTRDPEDGGPGPHVLGSPPTHTLPPAGTPSRPQPEVIRKLASSLSAPRSSVTINSSQATTHSQLSTADAPSSPSRPWHRPTPDNSAGGGGHGNPATAISCSAVEEGYSQLLTKSQMLSDSLVRDDAGIPPEIWDSEDEEDVLF